MVPAQFVVLEQLPLMPNGKVDFKALPAPQQRPEELGNAYVAPRNPLEQLIADVWREVLGIERVGVDDNFFELGGHSLLAAQVVERLGKARVKLPLRRIFEAPTIAELAADVAAIAARSSGGGSEPIPLRSAAPRANRPA
jgi:aryl carrier-like protein